MNIINNIKQWWRAYKEKGKLAEIERVRAAFRIKEKEGTMWIMHHDTAIFRMENFANVSEAIRILEETRDFAVEYAYGERKETPKSEQNFQSFKDYINPDA